MRILAAFGEPFVSGRSFPVIKLKGYPEWDFTLPSQPDISYVQACQRRDFTVNSMLMEVLTGEIIDPLGARQDIRDKVIRPTNDQSLIEDPLRAYRACQLAGRLQFTLHPSAIKLIKQVSLAEVKPERIYEELRKLLLLSPVPSIGLRYLHQTGILERQHPLLFHLVGCPQSPTHHPEGDAWEHTLLVVDLAAQLKEQSHYPLAFMFAALLHDIGKPESTQITGEKITSYGHDVNGSKLAELFLGKLTSPARLIDYVSKLVREHMRPVLLYKERERVSDKALRKLINRVDFHELMLLAEADFKGRTVERDFTPIRVWFNTRYQHMGIDPEHKIEPLVKGQDLLNMGYIPGRQMGRLLQYAYEQQLEGKNKEQILHQLQSIPTDWQYWRNIDI